ncbi:MAG: sugar phosphate isomerase/epimerase family protein [Gemmataceae bacterium]
MNRFALCLTTAALVALPLRAESPNAKGAEKLGWKLTLQSWTNNQKSVAESIDLAKELGVKYLEIYPGQRLSPDDKTGWGPAMSDQQIQAALEKAKVADVQIIDTGVIGIPGKEEDARKLFDWAKKVGITTIISEPDPNALPMIDKLAGEYGIRVGIHDHPKPSRYWDPDYVHELTRNLTNVGFTADVGHWKRSGLDPVTVLKKYGEKVFTLHFKDLVPDPTGKGMHDVVWGTGDSGAAAMLAVLKEKGFKGPIAIEFEYKWDVPTLQKCVNFFNAEANKLAVK